MTSTITEQQFLPSHRREYPDSQHRVVHWVIYSSTCRWLYLFGFMTACSKVVGELSSSVQPHLAFTKHVLRRKTVSHSTFPYVDTASIGPAGSSMMG